MVKVEVLAPLFSRGHPTPEPGALLPRAMPAGAIATPAADGLWRRMLNLLDVGLVVLDRRCGVLFANRAARESAARWGDSALGDGAFSLPGANPQALTGAVQQALRGRWSMVRFRVDDRPMTASVTPVTGSSLGVATDLTVPGAAALVAFQPPRPSTCLAMAFFKQVHQLTDSEAEVLLALCEGQAPADIAAARRVEVCTVRSQIAAVRRKTGSSSIRELQHMVAALPPILGMGPQDLWP